MARLFVLCLLIPTFAFGQSTEEEPVDPETPEVRYQARTEIEMDGAGVDGSLNGPNGALVSERSKRGKSPLFHPRTNFDPEMVQSVTQVR